MTKNKSGMACYVSGLHMEMHTEALRFHAGLILIIKTVFVFFLQYRSLSILY